MSGSLSRKRSLALRELTTEGLILTPTDNAVDLDFYYRHNPEMSHVSIRARRILGPVLCGHDGRRGYLQPFLPSRPMTSGCC